MEQYKLIKQELNYDTEYHGEFMDVIKEEFPIAVPQEEFDMASSTRHQPYRG